MTSGKSFWVECRENLKRRSWTCLLCLMIMVIAMPVWQAMDLSAMRQRMETDPYMYGIYGGGDPLLQLREAFLDAVTFNGALMVLILIFAVLFAVQGFSWQNSRRKLDLYLSVPVPAGRRFGVIYLNSVLMFGVSYLLSLLLTLLLGTAMGLMTGKTLLCALTAFLSNMIFFLAVHNLTLIAVMMTGNMLTGLLATGVFFFYEYIVRVLFDGMRGIFFRTYTPLSDISNVVWTSPLFSWTFDGDIFTGRYGGWLQPFLKALGAVAIQAVLYGGAAYWLYRKRRAEAAGHAMAFPRSRTVIKLLLMLPFTFVAGLWFRQLSEQSTFFTLLGMLLGLLLSHGLIQIIYEADIRGVLKGKWHILAAGLASGAIFAVFYYDLTGYDAWIPETSQVREAAFCLSNDIYGMGHYDRPFTREMYYSPAAGYILKNMHSQEAATLEALRELARRDQESPPSDSEPRYAPVVIKYVLNSGRSAYRTIFVEKQASADQMDIIFGDREFQTARYQIMDPLFMEHAGDMEAFYSNGLEETSWPGDVSELIAALAEDLTSIDYSLMQESLPVGTLCFRYHAPEDPEEFFHTWSYPVYERFEDTIGLLREQRIYLELTEEGSFVEPDQVDSITITCYNRPGTAAGADPSGEAQDIAMEWTATETFTDPEEIERILPALYPQDLEDMAGRYLSDTPAGRNYSVSVVFTPGVRFGARSDDSGRPFVVVADRLPGFVVEKTCYRETEQEALP